MLPLAELYPVFTERFLDIPEVQQGIVRIAWNHCVGATIRQISEPSDFQDGVLLVKVPHPQWESTLSSMKPEIIAKINRYLKRPLVSRVDIEIK
jgi:predicted nucleic acid-binding Zn ribbon protein